MDSRVENRGVEQRELGFAKLIDILKLAYLNTAFYILLVVVSAFVIPIATIFMVMVRLSASRRKTMRWLRRLIKWYGRISMALAFPLVRVRYEDCGGNDTVGPYLFVCNHRSSSDPFLVACLPGEIVQVVNAWPFRIPIWGFIARLADYQSINEISFEKFSENARRLLGERVSIASFPEGTRSGSRSMGAFRGGIFRLAIELKCPIVPVCISGNEMIPKRGSLLLKPGTILVRKLRAIQADEFKNLTPFSLKNMVRDTMANELAKMECTE